jgi:REP element-mobilizing transposase RayT
VSHPFRGDPPWVNCPCLSLTRRKKLSMPVSELLKSPFFPDNHYHLVFKSIDGILLFRQSSDYDIFLERFQRFISFAVDTWAYCLLSNHAHFIIKIKSIDAIVNAITEIDFAKQTVSMKKLLVAPNKEAMVDEMLERQVNSFMVSFANYTKNKYRHHGGLFQKPFKRLEIDTGNWLQTAIIYVHLNSLKHKVFSDYAAYLHGSYFYFLQLCNTYCDTEKVLEFFGGLSEFISLHEAQAKYYFDHGFPDSKLE